MKMLNCSECGLTITDAQEECPKCRTKIEVIKEELKKESQNVKDTPKATNDEVIKSSENELTMKTSELSEELIDEALAAIVEAEALAAIEEEEAKKKAVAEEDTNVKLANEVSEKEEKGAEGKVKLAELVRSANVCDLCKKQINDDRNLCPPCEALIESESGVVKAEETEVVEDVKAVEEVEEVEETEEIEAVVQSKRGNESNNIIVASGYIIFFLPVLCGYYRKSDFAKFHTKQATLLFIANTILFLVLVLFRSLLDYLVIPSIPRQGVSLTQILLTPFTRHHELRTGGLFYWYLRVMLYALHLMPFALMLMGIINVLQGKIRRLPVIGRFVNKKADSPK